VYRVKKEGAFGGYKVRQIFCGIHNTTGCVGMTRLAVLYAWHCFTNRATVRVALCAV
jgi:hypothetical protein